MILNDMAEEIAQELGQAYLLGYLRLEDRELRMHAKLVMDRIGTEERYTVHNAGRPMTTDNYLIRAWRRGRKRIYVSVGHKTGFTNYIGSTFIG